MFVILLCLCLLVCESAVGYSSLTTPECPVVQCNNGKVSGVVKKANHDDAKFVFNYNTIPFAEPPLGDLRFKRTTSLKTKWKGVLDGSKAKNAPLVPLSIANIYNNSILPKVNVEFSYSENCLNLNVFTTSVNKNAKLPVVVWLYGGGFTNGHNQLYDATALSGLNDLVVVIPNYRLGPFGFLSFGNDSILSGNVALHDQILALRWIKKNIRNFGGNPNNVLLMGESAGGVSVGLQVFSPMYRGLFHKVIYFSGVAEAEFGFIEREKVENYKHEFLRRLGMNGMNEKEILLKLQSMNTSVILQVQVDMLNNGNNGFLPLADGRLVKEDPRNTRKEGSFNKLPSIIMVNDGEFMGVIGSDFFPGFTDGISRETAKAWTSQAISYYLGVDSDIVFDKAEEFYRKKFDDNKFFYSKMFAQMRGELDFHKPAYDLAFAQSDSISTYMALGAFQLKLFHDPAYSGSLPLKPEWCNCDHTDDIFLTFGIPFINETYFGNPKFTDEEKQLSLRFMKFIANFARTGNPNNEGSNDWKPFTPAENNVMKIGLKDMTLEKNTFKEMMKFWTQDFV